MTGVNSDWRYYAIRFGFGIAGVLLTITLALASATYYNLKTDTKESFAEVKLLIKAEASQQQALLYKQSEKLDEVCKIVETHEFMLKLPFSQRQQIYQLPKSKMEVGGGR